MLLAPGQGAAFWQGAAAVCPTAWDILRGSGRLPDGPGHLSMLSLAPPLAAAGQLGLRLGQQVRRKLCGAANSLGLDGTGAGTGLAGGGGGCGGGAGGRLAGGF